MEPVLVFPSFGFQQVGNPCGLGRRCYYGQRDSSPLTLTSRLLQLFDEDDCCSRDSTLPSLVLSLRSRDTKRSDDNRKTKADDKQNDSQSEKEQNSDKFAVSLQLGDEFSPSELSVKLVDRSLKVEGKHEERGEDGDFSSRQFSRSFLLPDDVDLDQLTSSFSAQGVLNIEAPRLLKKELESAERNIPIEQGEAVASIGHENTPTEEQNEKIEAGEAKDEEDVEGE